MSTIYFAKLNFNSEIYNAYEDGAILTEFLNKVFVGLTEQVSYYDEKKRRMKFITLHKDNSGMWISGRIVLVAPGVNVSYDPIKDDIIEKYDENGAAYVTFYLDLNKESIAFVPRRAFGHVMFIDAFSSVA